MISKSLIKNPHKIRKLNLSYNSLALNEGSVFDQQKSKKFILNIEKFVKTAKVLNHIDLSGMKLNGEPLLFLSKAFTACRYLSVIHLNDN